MSVERKMPTPMVPDPKAGPSLRWAILGTGWVADRFVEGLHASTSQRVVAVGSRTPGRAAEFAERHGIEHAYGSYDELVGADADVVYIATGHPDHFAHASLALQAGKHVLIEKPMTMRVTEARQLAAFARSKGLFAMEAMWTLALPRYSVVRQVLESGMLGDIIEVYANLGERMLDHHRAMDPAQGGGVMNDLGTYVMMFAGEVLPNLKVIAAHGTRHETHGSIGQFNALLTDEVAARPPSVHRRWLTLPRRRTSRAPRRRSRSRIPFSSRAPCRCGFTTRVSSCATKRMPRSRTPSSSGSRSRWRAASMPG